MIVPVTGGVFRVSHVERVVGIHLRLVGHDMPFTLLGDDMVNKCFTSFKVILHLLHLVFGSPFRENGMSKFCSKGIEPKGGRD